MATEVVYTLYSVVDLRAKGCVWAACIRIGVGFANC